MERTREEPERSPRGAREEPERLVLAPGSAPRPSLQVRIYRHHNEHSHEEYEGERSAEASLLLLPRHFLDTS